MAANQIRNRANVRTVLGPTGVGESPKGRKPRSEAREAGNGFRFTLSQIEVCHRSSRVTTWNKW